MLQNVSQCPFLVVSVAFLPFLLSRFRFGFTVEFGFCGENSRNFENSRNNLKKRSIQVFVIFHHFPLGVVGFQIVDIKFSILANFHCILLAAADLPLLVRCCRMFACEISQCPFLVVSVPFLPF